MLDKKKNKGQLIFLVEAIYKVLKPWPVFLTAVVRASLGSYMGKLSSAYGWSGGFSPGSPVFAHLR